MRRFTAAVTVLGLVALQPRDAAAQTPEESAAASAILATPVGTFAPTIANNVTKKFGWGAAFGYMSPKTGESNNSIGGSGFMKLGTNAIVSATAGYTMVGCPSGSTCDNGLLLGGQLASSLWKSAGGGPNNMQLKMHGDLGWSSFGDVSYISAVVSAPFVMTFKQGGASGYVASARQGAAGAAGPGYFFHVTPGFGYGRESFDFGTISGNESGTRPMISIGGGLQMRNGMRIDLGFNRIFIQDTPMILSISTGFGLDLFL